MQDVGEHQLLVLLLVIEADLDEGRHARKGLGVGAVDETQHRGVDMGAIVADLGDGGAGDQPALRPRMPRPGADIIGIVQEGETLIEDRMLGRMRGQNELLEEPGGVGAVPLDGARVRHRLDDLVLARERRGAALGFGAHDLVGVPQAPARRVGVEAR